MVDTTVSTCGNLWFTNAVVAPSQPIAAALERLQAQTSSALPSIVYTYDLARQQTLCSSNSVTAMLGYSAAEVDVLGLLGLGTLIHPDDLQTVSDHFQHFMTLQEEDVIAVEYRMRRADGTWCWLRSQETLLVPVDNEVPLQILGLIQDISPLSNPTCEKYLMTDRDDQPCLLPQLRVEMLTEKQRSSYQN
uniref:PAS domain S-box protein n=1 Tax=Oscillatoriales cyanobacterium SpSt-402 TaxID=2282168 RepID=A0A832H6N1_9CYAN